MIVSCVGVPAQRRDLLLADHPTLAVTPNAMARGESIPNRVDIRERY